MWLCVVYLLLLQYASFQVISQVAAFCSKLCHLKDDVILFIVLMKWAREGYKKEKGKEGRVWRMKI